MFFLVFKPLIIVIVLCQLLIGASNIHAAELAVFAENKGNIYFNVDMENYPLGLLERKDAIAAENDFKAYFKQITGTELPFQADKGLIPLSTVLLKGEDAEKIRSQDFILDVSERGITISANSALGVINGLYTILDSWGCRWIMNGKLGEVIPERKRLTLSTGRETIITGMGTTGESLGLSDWVRRNRRMTFKGFLGKHYWLEAIPPKEYFKDHPEYYALIGGKRVPQQLCTSNPEVRELMVKKAVDWLKKHPNHLTFPMDPEDNLDFCQCENCQKLDMKEKDIGRPCITDRVIDFANYVAEHIQKECPGKKVAFYAYAVKKRPPTIKVDKNVAIGYTRSSECVLHLMPDASAPSSVQYWKDLQKWLDTGIDVYGYEYDPIPFIGGLPCPTYLERARALKKQYAMGVKGCITDGGWIRNDAAVFMNRYMEVRAKANPGLDPEKELADTCSAFFDPAGEAMNNYFRTLAKVTSHKGRVDWGLTGGYTELFTPELIKDSGKYLAEAIAVGKKSGNAAVQKRLKMVELEQNYLEAYLTFVWDLKDGISHEQALAKARDIYIAIEALVSEDPNYLNIKSPLQFIRAAIEKNIAKYYPLQMGLITKWQVYGPFDNSKFDGFDVAKQPVAQDGAYFIDGKKLDTSDYTSPEGFVDFDKVFHVSHEKPLYAYAMTEIESATELENAQLRTGSFNPFKVWLNNKLIWERRTLGNDSPDQRKINVTLNKGQNSIVLMVAKSVFNKSADWGFWVRFTDTSGRMIFATQNKKFEPVKHPIPSYMDDNRAP